MHVHICVFAYLCILCICVWYLRQMALILCKQLIKLTSNVFSKLLATSQGLFSSYCTFYTVQYSICFFLDFNLWFTYQGNALSVCVCVCVCYFILLNCYLYLAMIYAKYFVFFTISRWSIQHEPCRRQQSIQAKPTLPELSEGKELGSNSSSEKSSQLDEDLVMDKKRFSTSSTQVGDQVCS